MNPDPKPYIHIYVCVCVYIYIPKILKLDRAEDLPRQCVSPHPKTMSQGPVSLLRI